MSPLSRRPTVALAAAVAIACAGALRCRGADAPPAAPAQTPTSAPAPSSPPAFSKTTMPYEAAAPILAAHRQHLPASLTPLSGSPASAAAWTAWAVRHDAEIRARLERGYEDSAVNFWQYGTSFTSRPRVTPAEVSRIGRAATEDLLVARLDDLVTALAAPGSNERLQFVRSLLDRHGIDPSTPAGQDRASEYLVRVRERVIADNARYQRAALAARRGRDPQAELSAYATLYSGRGLSSDTSLLADFSVDRALAAMASKGPWARGRVRRVAIVGPGLDFTDKAEGHDFYPVQTVQPFAVVDGLLRHGLSEPGVLRLTAFDIDPRVLQHLDASRRRAESGEAYVAHVVLKDDPLNPPEADFARYWADCGDRIAEAVAATVPAPSGAVKVRAIRVRPDVVLSIVARDLDVVVERPAGVAPEERFDLIVATNVLVYYDRFEQALALANIADMLKPGGFLLTNYAVAPQVPLQAAPRLTTDVQADRHRNGDTMFWYERQ